jgi:hypothetical protein
MKIDQFNPEGAEDLVFVHNNLRLMSRKAQAKCTKTGATRMWDVGDGCKLFSEVGSCYAGTVALDEPEMESVPFEAVEVENVEEGMLRLKKFRKS